MVVDVKVLMVVTGLNVADGVASYAVNYFRKIDHDVIKMDFAVYNPVGILSEYEEEIYREGSKIYTLPSFSKFHAHYKKCEEIIRNEKYDIIHNNTLLISYPLMLIAKKNNVRIRILHSHATKMGETKFKELRNRFFLPILLKTSNTYAACSDMAGKAMFGDKYYTVLQNIINAEKFRFNRHIRNVMRKKLYSENKFVILTVGRMAEQKNPMFAMDVFKKLLDKVENAEYWWIGDGPLKKQVEVYVKELGIRDKIRLFGDRKDVNKIYQAADCFFLPSLFEGLPVAGIEAQASGLPCVISDAVTKEVVCTNNVSFVGVDNIEGWVREMVKIEKKENEREQAYYNFLNSQFSDEYAGEIISMFYNDILYKEAMEI